MTRRDELLSFYESFKRRQTSSQNWHSHVIGPELIWLDEEYLRSRPRVAIIGQEVLGWDYSFSEFVSEWSVADAVAAYREFDFAATYKHGRSSPFWRFFHQVRLTAFPDRPQERRAVLWANLVKFCAAERPPSILTRPYAEEAILAQQDLLRTELDIAGPEICLFVTGPNYDWVIERYYPDVVFEAVELPVRTLARLVHPSLPKHSYRTYHPNFLSRGGQWDDVFDMLVRELGWSASEAQRP